MTYTYRHAEERDREAVYRLYRLVMRDFISEIWGWEEQWQRNDFVAHFEPCGMTLVWRDDELVGYSHVEYRNERLFIRMIVVHPDHQRQGIGSKLLEMIFATSAEQCLGVTLEVFKINDAARRFYDSHGFIVEGETPSSLIMSHA